MMYGFHCIATVTTVFNVVLLNSRGFDSAQVGLIMAVFAAVGIFAQPFWGYVADRIGSMERTYQLVLLLQGCILLSLPLLGTMHWAGVCALAFALPASNFVRNCSLNLLNAWSVKWINRTKGRVTFGSVRMWGSLSWTMISLCLTAVAGVWGLSFPFYFCGGFCIFTSFFAKSLQRKLSAEEDAADHAAAVQRPSDTGTKINPFRLLKNYYFSFFLIAAFAIQMTTNATTNFILYVFEDIGADPNIASSALGLKSLMEIPFLLLGSRLLRRFGIPTLIVCTGCFLGLEQFLYTQVSSPVLVILITLCFNGMSFGLFLTTSTEYAYRLSPPELKSSAQTFVGMAGAMGQICCSLLGGRLIAAYGVSAFFRTMSLLILGISLLFALSFPFAQRRCTSAVPMEACRRAACPSTPERHDCKTGGNPMGLPPVCVWVSGALSFAPFPAVCAGQTQWRLPVQRRLPW